ncbi:MAG: hypothetical protein CMH57_16130 [Myxococcales bacterium]|nr:hypothetical protein [Myxococcales bacterium]
MARDDNEIKGEIIGELEDIDDPSTGKSLLDALMVERVEVQGGHVTIDLVFADDCTREERWGVENEVQDAIEDIEGIEDIDIFAHTRSAAPDAAPAPDEPEAPEAPVEEAPAAQPLTGEADAAAASEAGANLSVYSGGGCGAGTVAAPPVRVKPAPARPAPRAVTAPPEPVSAPAPLEVGGQRVTLSLAEYTRLVQAERDAQLRPSLEEHNALKAEHRILTARVASLQDAVRALLRGVEAEA